MSQYPLILFSHIAAATVLVGSSVVAAPLLRMAARKVRSTQELRALLSVSKPLSILSPIAALLVLASGVYLTSVSHFWTLGWVQVATALWIVNAVVAGAVVERSIHRIVAAVGRAVDDDIDARINTARWSARWTHGGDLLAVNDAAVIYLMVMRPALVGSLLVVVGANAVVLLARLMVRRSAPGAAVQADAPPEVVMHGP